MEYQKYLIMVVVVLVTIYIALRIDAVRKLVGLPPVSTV